jgi:uncharacterized protein (DUF305 family)
MLRKIALGFVALVLAGCSMNQSEYSMNDQMFASMMIPHHEQAVEMSELALTRTTNPDVLALAEEIRDAQQPEIDQMKSWGGTDSADHMSHGGMSMAGMLSASELANLRAANGPDFDLLFLNGMIAHHEGAIDMAQMIIKSKNDEVRTLGENIVKTQQAEIDRMRALIAALSK